jgi:hypothetical protein
MVRFVLLLALVFTLPTAARAQDPADTQLWALGIATLQPTEDWRVHLELQPRFGDTISGVDTVLSRWAVGRQVTPRVSVWAGHAWAANIRDTGNLHEQRLWQQLSVAFPQAGGWSPSLRMRLEQRWLDQWDGTSHRVRALGRFVRPLTADGVWSLAIWDEVFITLDDTPNGPQEGFDRNRLFAGVVRRLSPQATLEMGYLMQLVHIPAVGSRPQAHAALTWLNLTF